MSPLDWATRPLKKYADFSGRAPRAEYWWFYLLMTIGYLVASLLDSIVGTGNIVGPYGVLACVLALVLLVPSIAAGARRLHDTDRSGWWWLIILVPIVGVIVLIVFFVTQGTIGNNRYGADPYGGDVAMPRT